MKPLRWLVRGLLSGVLFLSSTALAEETRPASAADLGSTYRSVGLGAAAALAIAFSVVGASYAVGRIGAAALGAAAEKPELLTRSIVFVALAEGLAVLGFAFAMMLLQKM